MRFRTDMSEALPESVSGIQKHMNEIKAYLDYIMNRIFGIHFATIGATPPSYSELPRYTSP